SGDPEQRRGDKVAALRGDEVLRVAFLGRLRLSGSSPDAAARVRRSEKDPHPERYSEKESEHGREAGGATHGATLDQDRSDASPYAMSDCGRRSSSGRQTRARLSFDAGRSAALSSTLHHTSSTRASKVKRPWCRPSRVATTWSGARSTSETCAPSLSVSRECALIAMTLSCSFLIRICEGTMPALSKRRQE